VLAKVGSCLKRFRNWANRSTQRRLVIWSVGFWALAILILSVTFSLVEHNLIINDTRLRNTQFASSISLDVNTRLSNITSNARVFTRYLAALEPDPQTQAAALLGLRLSSSRYRALYYFDAQSNLIFDLQDSTEALLNIRSAAEITGRQVVAPRVGITKTCLAALKDGFSISNVYYTPLDYVPVIDIGMPVVFASGEKRIIVFEVDLTEIWQKIATSTIGQTGLTYVVSREGTVVAHPQPNNIGLQIPDALKPVSKTYEGTVQFLDPFTQASVLAAFSPVGGPTGWGIIVQQDSAEINASVNKIITTIIIFLLLLGSVGTVGILYYIRGFTRPIVELTKTTRDIAVTGKLATTRMTQRPDEVGQLSQAFDQMIEKVRHTESQLSVSEERYRSLFEHANDAILLLEKNVIIECNRKAEQMFAAAKDQLVGRSAVAISPVTQYDGANSRDREQELLELASQGQEQRFEWRFQKLNAELFDAEVSLNRLNLNQRPILISVIRDITERKRGGEALKQAQKEKEEAAVLERTRLAHDLHDAVSQTMFSASIIAEVLPKLWDKNPEEGRRRLEEIRQLTRGALAEMRTLLFELRPAALADAELGYLLRQLSESITGRSRIPVDVLVEGRCDLPADIKVALYRITQEALNNIAKHAQADKAFVHLKCSPAEVALVIRDNGQGFNLSAVHPESLGLGIMRERASGINAELKITSEPGGGSEVAVKLKIDGAEPTKSA
jgi:PAS domain S-box-containing protein